MTNADIVTLESIRAAAARIAPHVHETPVVRLTPTGIALKVESLHPVGSFKIRGAFNALLSLDDDQRRRGVVTHSSGNHAQALAYAARKLGIPCTVVMPENVPAVKLNATRFWSAVVHLVEPDMRVEMCEILARENGWTIVEPFDSAVILAGTGTIGLEILRQEPNVRSVVVPVSGGGLIGGVAAALVQFDPELRVIGVEPELANDAQLSLRNGQLVRYTAQQTERTIADGLRVPQLGCIPFANIRAFVDDIVTVSEDEIRAAMKKIAVEARLVAEPSGAVALAGALSCGLDSARTVAIMSGGNVEPGFYASILAI